MRYLPIAALAALALSGCTPAASAPASTPPPAAALPAPSTIADATVLDEKAGILAETTYTAASRAGASAARLGLIDKAAFQRADNQGYAALQAIRSAYDAGNATNYATALAQAYTAVAQITALTKGR